MARRLMIVTVCLLLTAFELGRVSKTEAAPRREIFSAFPMAIEGWHGERLANFDDRVLAVLGVDDYLNAVYARQRSEWVGVYLGYYNSQRQGDTIHSPANCLPGTGWQPVESGRISIPIETSPSPDGTVRSARTIDVNRFVVQKGEDKQLVLYWYQSHGRVIASEYWSKFYLIADAIHLNRTDGALVRVVTPLGSPENGLQEAIGRAVDFVKSMFPLLGRYLPS